MEARSSLSWVRAASTIRLNAPESGDAHPGLSRRKPPIRKLCCSKMTAYNLPGDEARGKWESIGLFTKLAASRRQKR